MSLVIGSFVGEHLPPGTQREGQEKLRGEKTANLREVGAQAAWESREGSILSSAPLVWASACIPLNMGSSLSSKGGLLRPLPYPELNLPSYQCPYQSPCSCPWAAGKDCEEKRSCAFEG